MLEEGPAQEKLQLVRYHSSQFKQPDAPGAITSIPGVSSHDFALAPPPPTPVIRGFDRTRSVSTTDVGESATMSGSISVVDFAYARPPATPSLRGVKRSEEIEALDLGEPALAK